MDGKALQQRIRALRIEIAAIRDSVEGYKCRASNSAIEEAAHKARIEALEKIQQELASLRPKGTS
jgi:CHAD domain-containing protein